VRAMHVCLVTLKRPSEIFYGGEEKFTLAFGKWLSDSGNDVTVVGRKLFGVVTIDLKQVRQEVPETKKIPAPAIHLPYLIFVIGMLITFLLLVLEVLAINRKSKISIIHAQDTGYGGLSGIVAAKILRVPVVISSHGLRYETIRQNLKGVPAKLFLPLELRLDSFVSKRAGLIIVVSSSEKAFFDRLGVRKENMVTIPIGIKIGNFKTDEEERQTVRRKLHIQQEILIGFVGRLSPEKNLVSLIEAFGEALKGNAKLKLLFVGTGPLEEKLKILSQDQGLTDKIIFTGFQTCVNRYLSALDIFIMLSHTEGCPTALLEAMSCGKAIVASNIPSIREIVNDKKEAILVNHNDVKEIKQAILLLSNDEKLRRRLGRNATRKVRCYDANTVYSQIVDVYRKLIHKSYINL
jgi:glycosyltransferase involved in cell wall biosynthesis